MEHDFVVFSAFPSHCSTGISLLVGCSLNVIVNLVFEDDEGWLVVADVAIKNFEFRVVAVYVPNTTIERVSFYRRLVLFLDNPKRLVLMSN